MKTETLQCKTCGGSCEVVSYCATYTRFRCRHCGNVHEIRSDITIVEDLTFKNYLAALARQEQEAQEAQARWDKLQRQRQKAQRQEQEAQQIWIQKVGVGCVTVVAACVVIGLVVNGVNNYLERKAQNKAYLEGKAAQLTAQKETQERLKILEGKIIRFKVIAKNSGMCENDIAKIIFYVSLDKSEDALACKTVQAGSWPPVPKQVRVEAFCRVIDERVLEECCRGGQNGGDELEIAWIAQDRLEEVKNMRAVWERFIKGNTVSALPPVVSHRPKSWSYFRGEAESTSDCLGYQLRK